jgi:hypothetical protein
MGKGPGPGRRRRAPAQPVRPPLRTTSRGSRDGLAHLPAMAVKESPARWPRLISSRSARVSRALTSLLELLRSTAFRVMDDVTSGGWPQSSAVRRVPRREPPDTRVGRLLHRGGSGQSPTADEAGKPSLAPRWGSMDRGRGAIVLQDAQSGRCRRVRRDGRDVVEEHQDDHDDHAAHPGFPVPNPPTGSLSATSTCSSSTRTRAPNANRTRRPPRTDRSARPCASTPRNRRRSTAAGRLQHCGERHDSPRGRS